MKRKILTSSDAAFAKSNIPTYSDYKGYACVLTMEERDYFRQTVENVLDKLHIDIDVYMCDHEQLGGYEDALGMHWKNGEGDEFITIDTYTIHDFFEVAFHGAYDLTGENLVSVLCHELAHIRYERHSKYHECLTERYIRLVEGENDENA